MKGILELHAHKHSAPMWQVNESQNERHPERVADALSTAFQSQFLAVPRDE